MLSLDADSVTASLARTDLPPDVRRVLELRQLTASGSVKKLYAMEHQASRDNRLRNLIVHHGTHPGRPSGADVQPLNLPKAGPKLVWCEGCSRPYVRRPLCPWCGTIGNPAVEASWSHEAVPYVLEIMAARDRGMVERFFGDALLAISGCIRGLFVSAPGHDFIASDYASLQAIVLAMLAGEQWRIDAFRERQPLYLLGASKITGVPVESYLAYHAEHEEHHPDRAKIGKVSELACGFGGWINSYRAFGSTDSDDVIRAQILAWRAASPAIVEFWGGQWRGPPWRRERAELYGLEGTFIAACQSPGRVQTFRGMPFLYDSTRDVLTIGLLSGLRSLTYHRPRLAQSDRNADELQISYEGWNTNVSYGGVGWIRRSTFGARICENVVMGHEVEILRFAMTNIRAAGYPMVLYVYDEPLAEVPEGFGSVEEFEGLMETMPTWASDWPIRAEGGYRAKRYRKAL